MRYLDLGGTRLSAIGLGAWQFGSKPWGWGSEFGAPEARAIVTRALELGVTLFDTAEIYGRGMSERVLGDALGEHRSDVFIATKLWPTHYLRRQVAPAARRSLRRLGTDYVELYQMHWPLPVVPLSWTMAGLREAREAGLIGEIGVSNFGLVRWQSADAALRAPVFSNQIPYNLLQRGPERDLIPFGQANDRLILAYSPLAQGLLSGRYTRDNLPGGFRRTNALFVPENLGRALPVLDVLREIASAHRVEPAQIALAWTIREPNVAAIPGAKSVWQMEQNAEAADIALAPDEVAALSEASAAFRPVSRVRGLRPLLKRLVAG